MKESTTTAGVPTPHVSELLLLLTIAALLTLCFGFVLLQRRTRKRYPKGNVLPTSPSSARRQWQWRFFTILVLWYISVQWKSATLVLEAEKQHIEASLLRKARQSRLHRRTNSTASLRQGDYVVIKASAIQNKKDDFVVDILSIGSQKRLGNIEAQRKTFGSHVSVRHFLVAHEGIDHDPLCPTNLTRWKVKQISNWCHNRKKWKMPQQYVMSYLQRPYAGINWLMKKEDPAGWMCAQSRPIQALYHLVQFYNQQAIPRDEERVMQESTLQTRKYPDYLLVIDDDTYFDIDQLQEYWKTSPLYANPSIPSAMAGCRIRSPINEINLTVPFGGYGQVFSQGYLEQLSKPIVCKENRPLCQTIRRISHLDERSYFDEATHPTFVDILFKVATQQPFLEYTNWTKGFCYHSDWIWGIMTNFYNFSRHNAWDDSQFHAVPQERLEAYAGSEIDASTGARTGFCRYLKADQCPPSAATCHYVTPEKFHELNTVSKSKYPSNYVESPVAASVLQRRN